MPDEPICSDCGAKLSPDAQGGLCVRCLFNLGLKTEAGTEAEPVAPITEKPGDRIGRYKLLQKLGEGGCGVVYMAEQEEPVRRRVALKVIKLGMDTREVITRFEAERQALALMDHPNIAKVLDGGATDTGRPYFVMEIVRGVRITEYCDQHNLPTRERLDLFIKVCQAIQHAHQKGIIHRDIKPSNILVTVNDGVPVPKVIDFGIAKATEGRLTDKTLFTAFQQFMGTPAYMSPEQAEMTSLDIDTRSDIYSLGVLLYELLTGKTPFDAKELLAAGLDALRRTIREQEPLKPSTRLSTLLDADQTEVARRRHTDPPRLMNLLRGDLDWIVMKALEKDRTRRYETANGFAADIQRHLNNEPVLASPPDSLYRLQKMVRRNQLAFAAFGAVMLVIVIALAIQVYSNHLTASAVMIALIIGLGLSTWLFLMERKSRKRAVKAEMTESQLRKKAETAGQDEARLRQEAEAISTFLTEMFQSTDPARDGGTINVAENLERAARKLDTDIAIQPGRRAKLQSTLGGIYFALGLAREAVALQEKARDYLLATDGPEHTDTLRAMHSLANSYHHAGRHDEGLELRKELLILNRKMNGPEHPDTLKAMSGLAASYCAAGLHHKALNLWDEVLPLSRRVNGREHPETIRLMENRAHLYDALGAHDEGNLLWNEVLPLSRKLKGPEHPDTLLALHRLAASCRDAGSRDEVLDVAKSELQRRGIDPSTLSLGPSPMPTGQPLFFPVSRLKLVVMSVVTFGYYEIYWFYQNWKLVKQRSRRNISPFWRAWFNYFYCYPFFIGVKTSAASSRISFNLPAGLLTFAWIGLRLCEGNLICGLSGPIRFVGLLAPLALLPIQKVVNDLNFHSAPGHETNARFSGWNIAGIVVVGILVVGAIMSAFFHK